MVARCTWPGTDPLYVKYHDEEWGLPIYDDRLLFAKLILDGAQAGLSWITILRKRDAYREAFDGFDAAKVARYRQARVRRLLANPGIVRNRLKIRAAIENAKAFLRVREEFGSFDRYIWQFVGGEPIRNRRRSLADVPARDVEAAGRVASVLRLAPVGGSRNAGCDGPMARFRFR